MPWAGRRDELVRRGDGGSSAGRGFEHRTAAGRRARERDGHQRELARLRGSNVADAAEPGRDAYSAFGSVALAVGVRDAGRDADPDSDSDAFAIRDARTDGDADAGTDA